MTKCLSSLRTSRVYLLFYIFSHQFIPALCTIKKEGGEREERDLSLRVKATCHRGRDAPSVAPLLTMTHLPPPCRCPTMAPGTAGFLGSPSLPRPLLTSFCFLLILYVASEVSPNPQGQTGSLPCFAAVVEFTRRFVTSPSCKIA